MSTRWFWQTVMMAALLGLLGACATRGPEVRVDMDKNVDFSTYRTFGFPAELGTDRAGYSTLITGYFKDAMQKEMTSRGYVYTDNNPDLLVNFFANVRDQTDVRSSPSVGLGLGYGYYGYRYGLYTAWPLYDYYGARDIDTVTYPVGTANIDIVDAAKKQLIWEAVAKGRISDEAMDNPRTTISTVVHNLMSRFPGRSNM